VDGLPAEREPEPREVWNLQMEEAFKQTYKECSWWHPARRQVDGFEVGLVNVFRETNTQRWSVVGELDGWEQGE